MKAHTQVEVGAWQHITGHSVCQCFYLVFSLHTTLTLTLWYMLQIQYCQQCCAQKKGKVCFALKIDLQLVLFHSICRTLNPSSERWRAVHLLCLLCWVGGGVWMQFTRFPSSHTPFVYFSFFFFFFFCTPSLNLVLISHSPPA